MALWAFVLAFLSLANLLVLTQIVQLSRENQLNQEMVWVVFALNLFFLLGFGASAYGLFRRLSWGRLLFLWIVSFWAISNLIALFIPVFSLDQNLSQAKTINAIQYGAAFVLPWWYLNLSQVKAIFASLSEKHTNEDISTHDNNH